MIYILFLTSFLTWAGGPIHWSHVLELREKHEFYKNDQVVEQPKDSWQHLFSLIYLDTDLNRVKDCVFFRVPGNDPGSLKIKTLSFHEPCDEHLLKKGDKEIGDIKSLHYSLTEGQVLIDFLFSDLRSEKWLSQIQASFARPSPGMSLSSAEFKAPKIMLLTSQVTAQKIKADFLKENDVCHDISEECIQTGLSKCDQCSDGWYEVPNGCANGPKFCGRHRCGQKDRPACRRGMKWQRKESLLDCVTDSSFAYCSKGFTVQCVGKKAFCR